MLVVPRFVRVLLGGVVLAGILVLVVAGLRRSAPNSAAEPQDAVAVHRGAGDPLAIILTPHEGDGELDKQIRTLQTKIGGTSDRTGLLENLGWAFVAKARLSSDPGFYTLAEQTAKAMQAQDADDPAAALLQGHVCHAMHRFAEAEQIARGLITRREFVFDYALLGDALMEQGKLGEAVEAYQKMVDLKPSLQTYSRVAHMRWLKGDLAGALHAAGLAARAGSPRDAEATAWAYARLASYQMQAGDKAAATASIDGALEIAPLYAPALLARGKLLLGDGNAQEAAALLQRAAEINPLPEYLWTAAEALRASGNEEAAQTLERKLSTTGAATDARTFAVFLATRGQTPEIALRLADEELKSRQDVFSYDAMAWAQFSAGQLEPARENMRRALAEGTKDARLFFHASAIAAASGDHAEALKFLNEARGLEHMLLPSERSALQQQSTAFVQRQP